MEQATFNSRYSLNIELALSNRYAMAKSYQIKTSIMPMRLKAYTKNAGPFHHNLLLMGLPVALTSVL